MLLVGRASNARSRYRPGALSGSGCVDGSIDIGFGAVRFVTTSVGLSVFVFAGSFQRSALPHDSRKSPGLAGSLGTLATAGAAGFGAAGGVACGAGAGVGVGWQTTSLQEQRGLNRRLNNDWRGGGVGQTHEGWQQVLHGLPQVLHGLPQVLHGLPQVLHGGQQVLHGA